MANSKIIPLHLDRTPVENSMVLLAAELGLTAAQASILPTVLDVMSIQSEMTREEFIEQAFDLPKLRDYLRSFYTLPEIVERVEDISVRKFPKSSRG